MIEAKLKPAETKQSLAAVQLSNLSVEGGETAEERS